MNKIVNEDLKIIYGGYIKKVHFPGCNLLSDPAKMSLKKAGGEGYAVYEDGTNKFLAGFMGENAYEEAVNFSIENGLNLIEY